MIYITGDTHADFLRFSTSRFPEQKNLTKDDYVIICGDFGGVWSYLESSGEEKYWLDWLADKPFTILFVDGNHENFDRLKEFPRIRYHGGYAHRIRWNIYHLMRGYVFEIDGCKTFAFGGAKSHDIRDGILRIEDFSTWNDLIRAYNARTRLGQMLRIDHVSWWEDELPTNKEMERGIRELKKVDFKVDYVVTHSLPNRVIEGMYEDAEDRITKYFDDLLSKGLTFKKWHCGHYHRETAIDDKYMIHYKTIQRLGEDING